MSSWNEDEHPRDERGQFTRAAGAAWVRQAAKQMQQAWGLPEGDQRAPRVAFRTGQRPPGWDAAVARADYLWRIPETRADGERTDAEHAEVMALEEAFLGLDEELGLGGAIDFMGRVDEDKLRKNYKVPQAQLRGFRRVGNHPTGYGTMENPSAIRGGSDHPLAGGIWLDPNDPGTRHNPRFRTDTGSVDSDLRKPDSRTVVDKRERYGSRYEDFASTPDDGHETRRRVGGTGTRTGRIKQHGHGEQMQSAVFLAWMKRAKARKRVENPNSDTWINAMNDQIEQRRRGGRR